MALHPRTALIIIFLGFCTTGTADFNLFMDEGETKRLLGIVAQLYYVREGIVNDYALSFNLPIPATTSDIYFSWQSLRPSTQPAMYYSLSVSVSNKQAMAGAQASIAKEGVVPTTQSVFKVTMPCTGQLNADVDVVIQLNVSIFSASNLTTLNIRRKKTCLKDPIHGYIEEPGGNLGTRQGGSDPGVRQREFNMTYAFQPPVGGQANHKETESEKDSQNSSYATTSTNVFYIAVGCACALILLIAFVVAVYYVRSQKSNTNDRMSDAGSAQGLTQNQAFVKVENTPNNSVAGMSSVRRGFTPLPVTELKAVEARFILQEVNVEHSRLQLGNIVMQGTFGRIYLGTLIGEDPNDAKAQQDVYVKTVKDDARPDQVDTMLKESCLLSGLCHPNINPILAACCLEEIDDSQPHLIFTHSTQGNLKHFLQRCKISDVGSSQTLNTQQLVYMAIHLARGVQYLHRRRLIHRDIATRNCVVDSSLTVKVTDTALSRDVFPNDYHCLGDNENRPVKWLSLEALLERQFSPASDVWSFGVTLWELMTLAQQPYADVDPFEMSAYLQEGFRISQPINCPDELFAVMACCWALIYKERPKITQLLVCLQDFYSALGKFV